MVKRLGQARMPYPFVTALGAIGDWWSLLIMRDVFNGAGRFGEFQQNLGIAEDVLSIRLKGLVGHGVFDAAPASFGGTDGHYVLTQKGQAILAILFAMCQIGEHFMFVSSEGQHFALLDRGRVRSDFDMFAGVISILNGPRSSSSTNAKNKLAVSTAATTLIGSSPGIERSAKDDALGVLFSKPVVPS